MNRSSNHNRQSIASLAVLRGLMTFSVCLLALASGCSRPFWREQAERDAYDATAENLTDPRWAVPRIDVTPDPRSRFYDPHDLDYAPLPPDDPDAHTYMHWVDGWNGYNCWHEFGDLLSVENPQWLLPFNLSPEQYDEETETYIGPLPQIENLTLGEALELALIHNRDYQTQIEDVFLAALVVTGERFQFSVRYLDRAGQTPGGSVLGTFTPQGGPDSVSMSAGAGISQFLPTGGQWVIELVNNTIWLFGGGNETATASTLSFALTQPLLRGAGRKVVLESLTQAERNLLYEVRDLARFRRVFFTSVVGGPSGYLNLLGQVQRIRNSESNILRLEEQVEALQAISSQRSTRVSEPLARLPEGLVFPPQLQDRIQFDAERGELTWLAPLDEEVPMTDQQADQLQSLSQDPLYQRAVGLIVQRMRTETVSLDVLRLQSDLADSINRLRQQEVQLQDSLDDFKILLGLQPDFLITIDDSLLEQFQFIGSQLTDLEREIIEFIPLWGQLDENEPDREMVEQVARRFQELQHQAMEEGLNLIRSDFEKLQAVYQQKLESLPTAAERERLEYDVRRDRQLFDSAVFELEEMRREVDIIAEQSQDRTVPIGVVKDWVLKLKVYQEALLKTVQSLQATEVGLRVELVELQPYEYTLEESVQMALENRLDLKNVQAEVMDARRRVEVAANALKSVLDLEFAADFRTPSLAAFETDPFDFTGDLSDFNVGLSFDTPIDQIQERNIYRTALIAYQQARREYMLFEDLVKQDVRSEWRQLEVLRRNLETARQALRISVALFDSAVEQAFAPPRVGQQPSTGTGGLQGQNIQQALSSILNAQDNIIGIWVSYEQSRLNIYRDMGIMDVGPDNVWEDPFYRQQTAGEGNSLYGGPKVSSPVDEGAGPTELLDGEGAHLFIPAGSPQPLTGTAVGSAQPLTDANRTGPQGNESERFLSILGPIE
jgi:hypothetical protein